MINSIPCLRQNPEKHTLAGRTSPLSPFKRVPPPGGQVSLGPLLGKQNIQAKEVYCFLYVSAMCYVTPIVSQRVVRKQIHTLYHID